MKRLDPVPALDVALALLERAPRAVVLVDGRSGSGKTTFASALAAGRALLRLEDVYPGWDGLAAASEALVDHVLVPRAAGAPGALHRWDWVQDRPGDLLQVAAAGPLVVEGCGALSRRAAALADLTIWVELPATERRVRALARDGAVFEAHWDRWAGQERAFLAREDPRRTADLVVDGRRFPQPLFSDRSGDAHYPRRP
jgi:cytidylate kinase